MRKTFIVSLLLSVSYECNGGLLQGFLEGAHEIHKQIHGAAGAVLGDIPQGLNIHGHFEINTQQNYDRTEKPTEAVVVIVNEHVNNEGSPGYQNPNQHEPQNYIPQENNLYQNGNINNNNANNLEQPNPPSHVNNMGPQDNQGQYNTPQYGNNYNHNAPDFGTGNQNNYRPPNEPIYEHNNNPGSENQNNYGNYQPGYGNQNQNTFEKPNKPNYIQNNGHGIENIHQGSQPNHSGFDNSNNNNGPVHIPEQGHYSLPNSPNQNNNIWPKTTETNVVLHTTEKGIENVNNKPNHDDEPLFVPLKPNEYVYGGDNIHIETPKRDTEDHLKPADEEEELPIDVRIKKE